MSVELRYAVPYVAGIAWTLNEVVDSVPVQDRFGNQSNAQVPNKPNIKFTIQNYDGQELLGTEVYPFEGAQYAALSTHIEAVKEAWADAFDAIREEFDVTKSQSVNAAKVGVPYLLRLDRWIINLDPTQVNSISALIGVYLDDRSTPESEPSYSLETLRSYKMVTAIDGKTIRIRQSNREQLVQVVKTLEDIVTGVNKLEDRLPADREQIKKDAARELPMRKEALVAHDKQEGALCAMSDLLSMPSVQQSVGLLCATLFTTLVNTDPRWANIDVTELMKPDNFKIPDVS